MIALLLLLLWQGPVTVAADAFGFDYVDTDIVSAAVVRFERQIDAGAWVSVAIPPKANDANTGQGASTYKVDVPALTPGPHTVAFRACSVNVCSNASPTLSFLLAVQPAPPTNPRVLKSGGE